MFPKVQEYAKFLVALGTVVATAGVGLIPADWIGWLQFVIAILGAVAVYAVPNAVTQPQREEVVKEIVSGNTPVTLI